MFKLKLVKRIETPKKIYIIIPIISIVIGVFIGYLVLKTTTTVANIDFLYSQTLITSFLDPGSLTVLLEYSVPIGLIALGYVFAYRVRFWNIGGEGQMLMGWIGATGAYVSFLALQNNKCPYVLTTSPEVARGVMMLTAIILGGVWALIPATLRIFLNVNEVLTTLMMNYIAYYIIWYVASDSDVWKDKCGYGFIRTPTLKAEIKTPLISFGEVRVPILFIVFIILALVTYFIINYTKFGFELRVVGDNIKAARYAGINIPLIYLITNFLGGALAGLAGYTLLETNLTLRPEMPGYGYSAIIGAWLAFLNPIAVIFSTLLIGYIFNVSTALQVFTRIHRSYSELIYGIILLLITSLAFLLRYSVKRLGKE